MSILIILLLVVALVAVFVVAIYNGLIKLRNKADEAWSDIDTQLKRRFDLIPNLVETVKGYASHEKETLEAVTKARQLYNDAKTVQQKEQAENMLTGALKSIFALAESYPDLKANQNFMELQRTLTEIEEHIQMSRRYYNGTVRDFNTKLQVFPNNVVAGVLGFKEKEYFQLDSEEERKNVKVSFSEDQKDSTPPAASQPATPAAAAAAEPKSEPEKLEKLEKPEATEATTPQPPTEEPPKEEPKE